MRTRINLLALLVVCGGAAALGPAPASATYLENPDTPKRYCCSHQWTGQGCCGDNGCRITARRCEMW